MKSINYIIIILLLSFISNEGFSQQYNSSFGINSTDSSYITASALYNNNDLVTASLINKIVTPGGSGFPDLMAVGSIALRKLNENGSQIWEVLFPNSVARVTFIKIHNNGDIIISGAFHDSIQFAPNQKFYSEEFRLNAFIASYSSLGVLNWVQTTTPHPNFSMYYINFDFYNDKIYAPINIVNPLKSVINVFNLQGDSIDQIQISDGSLLISELEFDLNGNLFICGTTGSDIKITGDLIGNDSTLGYISFIAKLNTNFQHDWSYSYEYITADFYPQMAIGNNHIAFIVDTIPNHLNSIGNHHQLTFYSNSGQHLGRDSIGGGVFNNLHKNIALEYFNNKFVFLGIIGWDTLSVISTDPQFNYTQLANIKLETFGTTPFFTSNENMLILNHSFIDSMAIVNDTNFVVNPKHTFPFYTYFQQLTVKFNKTTIPTELESAYKESNKWEIFPNPASTNNLNISFTTPLEETNSLKVFNINGSLIVQQIMKKNALSKEISINNIPSGIYFIVIENSKGIESKKWIKL